MIGIFGIADGINYPTRKHNDELVLNLNHWNDVIISDLDFFINNHDKILTWAKKRNNMKEISDLE